MRRIGRDRKLRGLLASAWLMVPSVLCAEMPETPETPDISAQVALDEPARERLAQLVKFDEALDAARAALADCEEGCLTPGEAAAAAYSAGEGQARAGRFILDIRSGGRSLNGALDQLFFVNSHLDYAEFGTLTIAFEPDAMFDLLKRPRVCGAGDFRAGRIDVKACRRNETFDLNIFTMMRRLHNQRIVVDGEVRLQWIDARSGIRLPEGKESGYYQVWVYIDNADRVAFVTDD